jgi:hypothetical protein
MTREHSKTLFLCALLGAFILAFVMLPPGSPWKGLKRTSRRYSPCRPRAAAKRADLFAVYVAVSALSIPGAAILTLLGGRCLACGKAPCWSRLPPRLGPRWRCSPAVICCATGCSSVCPQMKTVNAGMARDGAGYLFALRLMPLFPFFLVNLLMGLTRIGVFRYWWVSQLAMLPATVVFLNAGRELGKVTSLRDILSPGMVFAFTLLGLLPLVTRWLFSRYPLR